MKKMKEKISYKTPGGASIEVQHITSKVVASDGWGDDIWEDCNEIHISCDGTTIGLWASVVEHPTHGQVIQTAGCKVGIAPGKKDEVIALITKVNALVEKNKAKKDAEIADYQQSYDAVIKAMSY